MKFGTLAARVAATTAAMALTTATAQAAPIVRASSSIPAAVAAKPVVAVRKGRTVQSKDNLLGAPLFIAFLGAVVITIGTIIIVNKSNG